MRKRYSRLLTEKRGTYFRREDGCRFLIRQFDTSLAAGDGICFRIEIVEPGHFRLYRILFVRSQRFFHPTQLLLLILQLKLRTEKGIH